MDWLMDPHAWLGFATLLALEIVLGIDNVVFISILAGKLPTSQQAKARVLGLGLAMVMCIIVVIAVLFMMAFAGPIGRFVERHPTVKMLALSFLLLIGMTLIAEGLDQHIPKGYIYSAMAFSVFVEMLNLRAQKARKAAPVKLHEPYTEA